MRNTSLPYHCLRAAFLSSTIATILVGSLTGCQPKDSGQQPSVESHESHENNEHEHDDHEHGEHEHDDHGHDEHGHDEHEHDEHEHDEVIGGDHAGHNHDLARILFSCNPTKDIAVFYHNDSEPKTAHLLIDGIEYDLAEHSDKSVAGSATQTYYSELGLNGTNGLAWQVTDSNAVLSQVPPSKAVTDLDLDKLQPLYTCHQES